MGGIAGRGFAGTFFSGVSGAAGAAINTAIAPRRDPDASPSVLQMLPSYQNDQGVYDNAVDGGKGVISDIITNIGLR